MLGEVYSCEAIVSFSGIGSSKLEFVNGTHLEGKDNSKVITLNLRNQNVASIPINIADFFSNIEGIQWYNSNLQEISAVDLQQFPRLKVFSSVSNRLVSLNGDIFQNTPQLQWISFNDNSLENVGSGFLENLNFLGFADFRDNLCINRISTTREEMSEFRQLLQKSCPPLFETTMIPSTTINPDCKLRCSLNDEVDKAFSRIDEKNERISKLEDLILSYEERIAELERLVRGLSSNF